MKETNQGLTPEEKRKLREEFGSQPTWQDRARIEIKNRAARVSQEQVGLVRCNVRGCSNFGHCDRIPAECAIVISLNNR